MNAVTVREFQPGDEQAFCRLNEEWITQYFTLEPKDADCLNHPRETILDRGGRILFAVCGGDPVGCCALLFLGPGEYEVAKMAVTASARGVGTGRLLLTAAMETAKAAGATRLYLESSHVLTPAIHLYESLGFTKLPLERVPHTEYKRADVFMEWIA